MERHRGRDKIDKRLGDVDEKSEGFCSYHSLRQHEWIIDPPWLWTENPLRRWDWLDHGVRVWKLNQISGLTNLLLGLWTFLLAPPTINNAWINHSLLGKGANNQNGNLRWYLPWRGGGSRPVSSATYLFWKKDFFKNHLESFPDCENVFCT